MQRFKKILIKPKDTIKHALRQMDALGEKTLLVVDAQGVLLGSVTDGDIRRWILKGRNLTENVSKTMNSTPSCLYPDFEQKEVKQLMVKKMLECLPVVDEDKKVVSAIWWTDLFENKLKKIKSLKIPVVIMAGGEGSRLAPFTKILPKPLMPIGDKPVVEIIIDRFVEHGCKDFYLSVNYKANIIKAYFKDFEHKYNIDYVEEEKPLGTAGSLRLLKNKIRTTFFLSNCDILIEADYTDILKFHKLKKNKITLVSSMKNFTIPYGVCEVENGGILKLIREKPEFDYFVNTGMYILDKSVMNDIPKNKFYNMTDLISDYLKKGVRVGAYPVSEKSWIDMGQFEALQEMLKKFDIQS